MADGRFSALSTDPRYRLPSRKKARTAVDARFKGLFTDQDFQQKATVDRYGRRVGKNGDKKEGLKKLYRLENDSAEEEVAQKRDPAREGGFSESSSEDGSDSESGSVDEDELAEETAGQEQVEEIPQGEITRRLAAVNLDWDNLRATDIMAVASAFVPVSGSVESVAIYPSEFGRERMEQEDLNGPPKEIFSKSAGRDDQNGSGSDMDDVDDEEDDEKIKNKLQQDQLDNGEEFDMPALRQYQLERLRYYYAVITCDSKTTAKAVYDEMDRREYFSTSNYFDLRFIPDDTSFEGDVSREECTSLPDNYKPNEFRTDALTHSKVRLTWDGEDTTRKEVLRRAFSRAEMDENDLQAYIGSDSSDADSVASRRSAAEDRKLQKSEERKNKTRAMLGLSDEASKTGAKKDVVGDIQITFTPGISGSDEKGVFENEPQDEESTRQRYIRKEKERKQKRKERMKAGKTDGQTTEDVDAAMGGAEAEDKGFDDAFFTDPAAAAVAEKTARKADKQKKLATQAAQAEQDAEKRAELELLMADDHADNLKHFDMREIERAEKDARRKYKKKRSKRAGEDGTVKDGFQIETKDPRFGALYESHEYAIDPSNPKFKGTQGMKALLDEGRKKRKRGLEN